MISVCQINQIIGKVYKKNHFYLQICLISIYKFVYLLLSL